MWDELTAVNEAVNAEECRTKISKERRTEGQVFYSPVDMNRYFKNELNARDWNEMRISRYKSGDPILNLRTMGFSPEDSYLSLSSREEPLSKLFTKPSTKNGE